MAASDIIGARFGRLLVTEEAEPVVRTYPDKPSRHRVQKTRQFKCRCNCGEATVVALSHLRSGQVSSCGCLGKERRQAANLVHGEASNKTSSAEYRTWAKMIERCENPKVINFANYGGRGIRVCERWRSSFEAFLADMGRKPSPKHSIDRYPDNDGNYEPTNCRWATAKQQRANRRPRGKSCSA